MSSITRPLANRAVHLRITPRPSNLGESREILRLLSGFGEIEYYKNLRYDVLTAPDAALVIYKDNDAAMECLRRSPIRFRMGKVTRPSHLEAVDEDRRGTMKQEEQPPKPSRPLTPWGLNTEQRRDMSTSTARSADGYTPFFGPEETTSKHGPSQSRRREPNISEDTSGLSDADSRVFQVQANPSFRKFRDRADENQYHGSFAMDLKQFGQADLYKKVPQKGLSCCGWRAPKRPWDIIQQEKQRDATGIMRRRRLGELYEEGMAELRAVEPAEKGTSDGPEPFGNG
jgi:hypothetical protein